MKVRSSLRNINSDNPNVFKVHRHGRIYLINKKNPRMNTRQGKKKK